MPTIFNIAGYRIYFYSNENNEPCHVHIAKGKGTSSKVWIEPEIKLAHNDAQIPKKDLKNILEFLKVSKDDILTAWRNFFAK